jgi:hypothetical protein
MRNFFLVSVAAIVALWASSSFGGWTIGWAATPSGFQSILGTHVEMKNSAPAFVTYFVATNKAIVLNNLDKADIQAIKKALDDAFLNKRLIGFCENAGRLSRTGTWYELNTLSSNGTQSSMTFYDVYSGDNFFFRVK